MVFGIVIAIKILGLSGHQLASGHSVRDIAIALVSLCLIASGNYGINEILDAKTDAMHPQKKYRAIPSGRISVRLVFSISIVLYIVGICLSLFTRNWTLFGSLLLLAISGFVYNVPPVRLKDRTYVDFIAEALNNPIRFMVGWYAVATPSQIVPVSFLLAYWFIGVFLMAAKRFGEIRLMQDSKKAAKYRRSLGNYTQESLLMAMIGAVAAYNFMIGALSFKYSVDVVVVLPFIIFWTIWFFKLAFEENTIVKDPERIFEKKGFLAFSLLTVGLFLYFFYTGNHFLYVIK